ncbi:MAG TPA: FAD-binding oxidoreductase [Longimicrobiales bacterium]|nr:FAD-binding oxidoreductase [Longimicrobiales bacterium]
MIERLRGLAGGDAVRSGRDDDAVHEVAPGVVVMPDGSDACAAVLAACSEEEWTVEIGGGRTARSAGRPVSRIDVLLSTARIRGVTEYEPDDLTIGVAGGTQIGDVRARVAAARQRLPLDPTSARASVGGVLARGAAGPMRRSWATPRRQVLGIELVTGDGRVLSVGGRVVKNVAGYDLNKLIVGSAGTLGVITRVHLRLLPLPRSSATLVLEGSTRNVLTAAARELLEAPVEPVALELIGSRWRLIALYEGAAETVAAGIDAANGVATRAGASIGREDDALERLAAAEAGAPLVIRVADLPSRLEGTLAIAQGIAGTSGTIAAHAGDGIARVMPRGGSTAPGAAAIAAAIEEARAGMKGGTVIIERGTTELLRLVDPWGGVPESTLRLTRELKRQFDPAGILQHGRWVT